MNIKLKYKSFLPYIIFFSLFIFSLAIYKDYGISIDELSTRLHGQVSFNYISTIVNNIFNVKFNTDPSLPLLKDYDFREYGVIFELISLSLEKLFSINDFSKIFYLKHLLTHFFFILGIIFLVKIILKNFNNIYLSLWSGFALYSTPRIFSHSFYNNKDIIFMSFFIIALYFTFEFLKKKNLKYLLLSALSLALLTATRSIGFYFFIILILFLIIEIFEKKKGRIKIKTFAQLIFLYFLFTYIFWPFLWEDPVNNFIYSFISMSDYDWRCSWIYIASF